MLTSAGGHYGVATLLDPEDLKSWIGLAQVRHAQGRLQEARAHAERASALAPDDPSVVELQETLARSETRR